MRSPDKETLKQCKRAERADKRLAVAIRVRYDLAMESVLGEDKSVNRVDVCGIVNFEGRQKRYVHWDIEHSTSRLSDCWVKELTNDKESQEQSTC